MTERSTKQDVVIRYARTAIGGGIFIWEVVWGAARPVVVVACLGLMGYEGAKYLDLVWRSRKERVE